MDIARPDIKRQKRRRQIVGLVIGLVLLGIVTIGVSRLKPAAPEVERSTVWTDTVKRGPMLRQVRGLGSLIPSQEFTRQIPAETEATVVRIRMLPGSQVKADSILLEMSNPQLEQAELDARLQLKAAEAEYQSLRVKLQSDLMNQKAGAATVHADDAQAQRQADTDKALYELGVISGLAYKSSRGKADEFTTRNDLETQRLAANQRAIESQMAQEQAKVDEMRTLAQLKQGQLDALKVRAGIDGVLVDLPLQVGQHVLPGTMLAKVVEPEHLMATLKVAETQARDVQIGELASIDTHNGLIGGNRDACRSGSTKRNGDGRCQTHRFCAHQSPGQRERQGQRSGVPDARGTGVSSRNRKRMLHREGLGFKHSAPGSRDRCVQLAASTDERRRHQGQDGQQGAQRRHDRPGQGRLPEPAHPDRRPQGQHRRSRS